MMRSARSIILKLAAKRMSLLAVRGWSLLDYKVLWNAKSFQRPLKDRSFKKL
jgi:hypothetical protein